MEELYIKMKHRSNITRFCPALTLLEMVIAMAIMAVLFAVLVPLLRAIQNSWDSKAGDAEMLQNGRVLMDHLQRNLSTVSRITAVSSSAETDGYIEFQDNDANSVRYDINGETGYVEFGPAGNLADLAGPVTQFQFTCYDACDLDTPLDPVTDTGLIRFVKVQTTLTNSAGMGQDLTLTASAYLRTDAIGTDANDPNLLFVSGGQMVMDPFGQISCVPTAQESLKISLIESWGYTVTIINCQQSQAEFDAAVADANVAYISEEVNPIYLGTKLTNATIGVVNEQVRLHLDFQFSEYVSFKTHQQVNIVDNTHYITSGLGLGLLSIFSSDQPAHMLIPPLAPGLSVLARSERTPDHFEPSLAILEAGAELYGGGNAAGRRVQLPWGDDGFDINALNANGRMIMKRSIEWAAAVKGSGGEDPVPGEGTYRDEFNASDYSGNDGTLTWKGDWQEINESDGPVRGDEIVATDPLASPQPPSNQLRVRDNDGGGEGVVREADLNGAATATLSFLYRRYSLDDASAYVAVELSINGAAGPWTEIARFEGPANESAYLPFSQDISAYIAANFAIRFISSPNLGDKDDVWFDDVEIQLSP